MATTRHATLSAGKLRLIPRFRYRILLVGAALLALQLFFLEGPGIEEDEALFVGPFVDNAPSLYEWHAGHFRIPVMTMDYIGALKSWLYWPVFHFWTPNVWSMRLPACLLSVVTLLLFADVVRRAGGSRMALAAALFLATDAVFVLINVFDMTVCLLLLGTMAFLNLLQRFGASGKRKFLGAAFLMAGLALWYKAIFIFPLAAMMLGAVVAYPGQVWHWFTRRNLAVAAIGIAVGAAPLIAFNWERRGATVQASGALPSVPALEKLVMLQHTLDGRAFEHYMFRSTFAEKIPLIGAPIGDLVIQWYRESHFGPGSALLPALLLALVALPFLRRSAVFPALLFSWVAMAAAYGAMFVFRDAGAGPHHTVLLYPAPHFIVAASAAAVAERYLGSKRSAAFLAFCLVLVASNAWLLGRYAHAARANGFSAYWNDGVERLAVVLHGQNLPVAILDWGIHNGVQIHSRGSVAFADPAPRENVLYVTHCSGYVIDESRSAQFQSQLAASALRVTANRVVADKKGHLMYCLFQLERN
jgi:4-amino-4-deoxy-L-arabinose transferase-like glycosyltransferase